MKTKRCSKLSQDFSQEKPRGTPCTYKGVKFLSKFEKSLAETLDKSKMHWQYEPMSVDWQPPVSTYTPDFVVTMPDGTAQYVEVKGFLDVGSRIKMLCVKEQYPDLDIAFLFMRGNNRLTKAKNSLTYTEWAKKNGFKVLEVGPNKTGLVYA